MSSQEESLQKAIRHLLEVEGFSLSQIALKTGVSRKKVTRLLGLTDCKSRQRNSMVVPYEGLIRQWYGEYPFLQAIQVLQRLKSYGYRGGYTAVKEFTLPFRKKRKKEAFHEVTVFPGQEAQVDWMQRSFPFGKVYGFVYLPGMCTCGSTRRARWSSSWTATWRPYGKSGVSRRRIPTTT